MINTNLKKIVFASLAFLKDKRIKIFISSFNLKGIDIKKHAIEIIAIERVDQAYQLFF